MRRQPKGMGVRKKMQLRMLVEETQTTMEVKQPLLSDTQEVGPPLAASLPHVALASLGT